MIYALRHRGPDCQIFEHHGEWGFAHARLSIVDLDDVSNQPFWDDQRRYCLVFNGEIYNYQEIRRELEVEGARFRTKGDTEVLLQAYVRWGMDAFEKLNGMWALAIWDDHTKTLLFCRDRFGVKPLYLHEDRGTVYFASEIKALISKARDLEIDPIALRWYLEDAGCDRGDLTLYRQVRSVRAGSAIRFTRDGRKTETQWWNTLARLSEAPSNAKDREEKFRELLFDSVRLRLRTDVEGGLTLSSGLDSPSIYAVYHELLREGRSLRASSDRPNILTPFVVSYPGKAIDEGPRATELVRSYGDTPRIIVPEETDFSSLMDEVTSHQESLVWNASVIAFHQVYRSISKAGIRVILEGHGSDEMLGGYPYYALLASRQFTGENRFISAYRAAVAYRNGANPDQGQSSESPLRIMGENLKIHGKESLAVWKGRAKCLIGRDGSVSAHPRSPPSFAMFDSDFVDVDLHEDLPSEFDSLSPLKRELYLTFHRKILPNVLRVFDRATMAHGIESRAPFMDYRLVQYVFSMPDADFFRTGFTKSILRRSMRGLLPHDWLYQKRKLGFALEIPSWFNHPEVRSRLRAAHSDGLIRNAPGLDARSYLSVLENAERTEFDWVNSTQIWKAYSYARLYDRFIARRHEAF